MNDRKLTTIFKKRSLDLNCLFLVIECSVNKITQGGDFKRKLIVLVRLCVCSSVTHREMGGGSREKERQREISTVEL